MLFKSRLLATSVSVAPQFFKCSHNRFFPDPFQFSTPCYPTVLLHIILVIESFVKYRTNTRIYTFVTSTVDNSEWSDSRPWLFNSQKMSSVQLDKKLCGPRGGLEAVEMRYSLTLPEIEPLFRARSPCSVVTFCIFR
jgi:hypothetical protein